MLIAKKQIKNGTVESSKDFPRPCQQIRARLVGNFFKGLYTGAFFALCFIISDALHG